MNRHLLYMMGLFLIFFPTRISGITEYSDSADATNKAVYVYNIIKLIDWPNHYRQGAFVIGFVGNADDYQLFSSYIDSKSIGNQPVYSTLIQDPSALPACHVLFINAADPNLISDIALHPPHPNTMLITCCADGIGLGATFNLFEDSGHLRFELSLNRAESLGLFVGSTLRGLAHNTSRR